MKDIAFSILLLSLLSIGYMTVWAERQIYRKSLTKKEWEKEFDSELGQKAVTFIQFITLIVSVILGYYLFTKNWILVIIPLLLLLFPITRGLISIIVTYIVLIPLFRLIDKLENETGGLYD